MDTGPVATRAAADFRQQVETLRKTYANRPPVTVFYQVWQQPLMTLNGQHMVSDMLALCGGRNLFGNEPPLVPTVSVEAVVAGNPEAMMTAGMGATRPDKPLADFSMWENVEVSGRRWRATTCSSSTVTWSTAPARAWCRARRRSARISISRAPAGRPDSRFVLVRPNSI